MKNLSYAALAVVALLAVYFLMNGFGGSLKEGHTVSPRCFFDINNNAYAATMNGAVEMAKQAQAGGVFLKEEGKCFPSTTNYSDSSTQDQYTGCSTTGWDENTNAAGWNKGCGCCASKTKLAGKGNKN